MVWFAGNKPILAYCIPILNIVLEIGFGGGSATSCLAKQSGSGVITGVDISADMVHQAERRFRREIDTGRLCVQVGGSDSSSIFCGRVRPGPHNQYDSFLAK